jgi:protoheme IX farnesyltransferase
MNAFFKTVSMTIADYVGLCKLRVVLLMILTAIVGMYLAVPRAEDISPHIFFWANIGIALCACSAAVVNHLVDRHIDSVMMRTKKRPLVQGKVTPTQAIIFSVALGVVGFCLLLFKINTLTAVLTLLSLVGYAGIYTGYLKRATPQNIVIGGLAGAAPPLLGWTAVSGHFDPEGLLLVLIIFVWTPPHFWALAIARYEDYSKAEIPMLPVTHGIPFTKLQVVLYTALLTGATLLPYAIGMSGFVYLIGAVLLNARFWYWVMKMKRATDKAVESAMAMKTFQFSIVYLMILFVFLLVDHYWR